MTLARGAALACLVTLGACKNVAPDADVPAVIVDADDASRAALQNAVNDILGTEALLAADALTGSSTLIIERRVPRSIEGSPAAGRTMDPPIQLRLVTDGRNCVLVDGRDGSRHLLVDTVCAAAD